jgi:uncharacterized protein YjiS (DUF1127 family)
MTTSDACTPARHGNGIAQILHRLRQKARIWRDTRRLADMDDHMLRDNGIHRGDIPLAVRFGRHP